MVEKNEESVAALTIYNLQSARGYFFKIIKCIVMNSITTLAQNFFLRHQEKQRTKSIFFCHSALNNRSKLIVFLKIKK